MRDLKNNLSRHLKEVQAGGEVIVTERGTPIARIAPLERSSDRLAQVIADGLVRPPKSGMRRRPAKPIKAKGSVSDLVSAQRG